MTSSSTATLKKTTATVLPDVLYDFSMAVIGNHCRTLPVMKLNGIESSTFEWLEAHQTRMGEWKLFSRRKTLLTDQIGGDETPANFEQLEIKPNEDAGSYSLMDIMTIMAQFEKGQLKASGENLVMTDLKGHRLSDLGDLHYKAFGINECIAFDEKTGFPAPSFEGRIAGDGDFSDEMEKALIAAWDRKVAKFGQNGSYLDVLRINGQSTNNLEELFSSLNKQKSYAEIINYFEGNFFVFLKQCDERGFDYKVVIEEDGKADRLEQVGVALEMIIQQTLDEQIIEKSYSKTLSDEEIDNIVKILISLDIFRAILHARWAMEKAIENPELASYSEDFTKQSIADIQKRYKDHQLAEVDEALLTDAIFDKTSAQAMTISKTIDQIRKDLDTLQEEQSNKAKTLQEAPSNIVTKTLTTLTRKG